MFLQQVMTIKKLENAALSLQDEDNFLEAISHMSRLRHQNIVPLTGYCTEHGQRLLVHDYIGNGSLQDMLYLSDDRSKVLTWNVRIKLALGIARALEYVISYNIFESLTILRSCFSSLLSIFLYQVLA